MIDEIRELLNRYTEWLRDKTVLRQVDDWTEITTPHLDRHNDYLQIYAKRDNSSYILTDDGYTIQDLKSSGCNLESPKRQDLLKVTLNGFGVHLDGDALLVKATLSNFPMKKHSLVQAMLAVNDLFFLATPVIASLFLEDVIVWLELHEIRYTPTVKFTGRSGYDHLFDFVIPKSRRRPERIARAINRPHRETAEAFAFAWIDTKEVRPPDSRAYAFLNDTEQKVTSTVVDALRSYDVTPVLWSQREQIRTELVE